LSEEKFLKGIDRLYQRYPEVNIRKNGNELKMDEPLMVGELYEMDVRIDEKSYENKEFDNLTQAKDEIEKLRRKIKEDKVQGFIFIMWGILSIILTYLAVNSTEQPLSFGPVNIPLLPFVSFILICFFCGIAMHIVNVIKENISVTDIRSILYNTIVYTIVYILFGGFSLIPLAIVWLILNYFQMNTYISMYFGMIIPAIIFIAGLGLLGAATREYESQIRNIEERAQKLHENEFIPPEILKYPKVHQIKGIIEHASRMGDFIFPDDIELLVVARAKDIEINPEFGNLFIPKTGSSKSITFELLPKLDGENKIISISFFYENNFYGEISQSVRTEAKR
jgi:hypothetical protein